MARMKGRGAAFCAGVTNPMHGEGSKSPRFARETL